MARLAETSNDGPSYYLGAGAGGIDTILPATTTAEVTQSLTAYQANPESVNGTSNTTLLQDTRDWFAWHGVGSKKRCNILMADGSVQVITDQNGDRFFNPGFSTIGAGEEASVGYADGTVDLPAAQMWNGVGLPGETLKKASFE